MNPLVAWFALVWLRTLMMLCPLTCWFLVPYATTGLLLLVLPLVISPLFTTVAATALRTLLRSVQPRHAFTVAAGFPAPVRFFGLWMMDTWLFFSITDTPYYLFGCVFVILLVLIIVLIPIRYSGWLIWMPFVIGVILILCMVRFSITPGGLPVYSGYGYTTGIRTGLVLLLLRLWLFGDDRTVLTLGRLRCWCTGVADAMVSPPSCCV